MPFRQGRNLNVTISISTFKIGSGRAEKIVSPDCRPPSIVTAPKPGKILSEPCGYREKSHSSKSRRSVKRAVGTAKIQTRADTPDIFHKHGMSYYDYGKS